MTGRAYLRLSALLIISAAWGCDNVVEWGGVHVELREPPPATVGAPPDTVVSEEETVVAVPDGPVLYMAERDEQGLKLIPVGAIVGDSIEPFPSESEAPGYRGRFVRQLLAPGSEFVLFARGVRVGSFTLTAVETDESFCVARPSARGITELIAEAAGHGRFLALPREYGGTHAWNAFQAVEMDLERRNATLSLPREVLTQEGADQPSNILDTRWDMQAFRPAGVGPISFAVTYLFRDRLQIERPPPTAYSLFLLGMPAEAGGYGTAFHWYRHVARNGKGAARFFEQVDWHGDGEPGVLLEVLGEGHRWLAALQYRNGTWTRIHEDPCGAAAPPIVPSN